MPRSKSAPAHGYWTRTLALRRTASGAHADSFRGRAPGAPLCNQTPPRRGARSASGEGPAPRSQSGAPSLLRTERATAQHGRPGAANEYMINNILKRKSKANGASSLNPTKSDRGF
ncbi:unnamed protein product [Rangifer tarandus platyrhynchus]|uniref:Uncharacterized protein n=1 Tax=Rangifer tarandus platyrhynchus TaxID=3082113 RepID=A0ABN8Y0Q2_RANTA|nr:unnamed protein product [Rangifer tarandus platyrhynchus]